ncbi:required for cell viability [Pyrenophora seminiperda CCB06]|uniref:Required for cell viability n=1 Tax=Pyrenophora seminiperda CCB06 TaxID=1302712 RepID=A0A3M7M3L6_9PLEO|nr:required for cell viability [Pyrenophora seminiperda CCB06]
MGALEESVDAAANFIGPFVDKDRKYSADVPTNSLVDQALLHLQAINTADLAADPNAPYDASLAGVVYGLLDLVALLGIIPRLSSGVAFSQRPRSTLTAVIYTPPNHDLGLLAKTIECLLAMMAHKGSGVQPLLSQRILPDIISALAELSFSHESDQDTKIKFTKLYESTMKDTPTSRLLAILTTFLHQPLPAWFKPVISSELSAVPLRPHGVRHTIEFISLSYLSKNSQVPQGVADQSSQIPIPLEAVTQASKLLVQPPSGIALDDWLMKLTPQLLHLLDGNEGRELSRAAGQIIAGGILSKRTTGAPGSVGWETFAGPLLRTIYPRDFEKSASNINNKTAVIVKEADLKTALRRLHAIASSYSHTGLIKRLISPVLLPLWALLSYTRNRPLLNKEWGALPSSILSRYMEIACDVNQIDNIATNIFWNGDDSWTFEPGSEGGVEIRRRSRERRQDMGSMESIVEQISNLDDRVSLLVSLLAEAKIPDEVAGSIFLNTTRRWLAPEKPAEKSLIENDPIGDPLAALVDAKLSEALAQRFQKQLARSPQHIIELVAQLIQSSVSEHKNRLDKSKKVRTSKRAILEGIVQKKGFPAVQDESDATDEDLLSFALGILNMLIASPDFKKTPPVTEALRALIPPLTYLSEPQSQSPLSFSPLISNSATTVIQLIAPMPTSLSSATEAQTNNPSDTLAEHRATLKTCLEELQSPEAPNRTWALNALHTLLKNPTAFKVVDVPSLTHTLLSASLADPESYVHLAAIPVVVSLANRAPRPVVSILVDAFIDIDERSLKLARGKQTEEKELELRNAMDFRLRVGEVLNNFVDDSDFWNLRDHSALWYKCAKQITEACLSLASRRGQRTQTLLTRTEVADHEKKLQEDGEAAWGGPIPNVFDPDDVESQDKAEYEALQKIIRGWEDTGIEEDVRVRASALSVLSIVFEHRLEVLRQPTVDAALQIVLLVLTVEREESKALLRRAAVLAIMGLLRGFDAAIVLRQENAVGLNLKQQGELERVVNWVADEDGDELVKDHARSVVEGLETLRVKKLYRASEDGLKLGQDLGLEGNLRGLDVHPQVEGGDQKRKMVIEEIE